MKCRDRQVGVIIVQHQQPKFGSRRETQLTWIIGFLVAAEAELVRVESTIAELAGGPPKSTTEARIS
jgi:hypothetical protein